MSITQTYRQTQQGQGDLAPELAAADIIALHCLKLPQGEASQKIRVITLIIWFPCSNFLSLEVHFTQPAAEIISLMYYRFLLS